MSYKIDKKYIFASELTQKLNIHSANISILHKNAKERLDDETVLKINSYLFIDSESMYLPRYIREGIMNNEFTDMSDKVPAIKSIFGESKATLVKAGIVDEVVEIAGKKFYVLNKEFMKKTHKKVLYVLSKDETMDCYKNGDIDGYIKLKKDRFLTWY